LWSLFFAVVVTFGVYTFFTSREAIRDSGFETGQAIMRFGKAFPEEAIREVIRTKDGDSYFLRLYGGRTGCILAYERHATCRIIEPDRVQVRSGPSSDSLTVDFFDKTDKTSVFVFRTPNDAAEVSLWLLGSFVENRLAPENMTADPTLLPPNSGS
jgi:hypothetical protein